ncbi:MAG: methyl-accepting chemotaxis protein [Gammaproteobacteria bacterium]|nr:methyl-accepting chemotaxis protein [Gammaproteobacteria bacterium]MCW8988869.1 methyl-accepting chemotaxis protein [Gammaproteobacteria bacterium]
MILSYLDVRQSIPASHSAQLSELGINGLLFIVFALVGIAVVLIRSAGGSSKQTLIRLQEYIQNPQGFRQGLKHDGNGKHADLFELIDVVILNVTNKLDRVEDAGSILAGAASELSYDAKDLNEEMKKQYSSIDQVATAVNEMTATVQEVARNTAEASSAADSASMEAQGGALESTNAIGAIEMLDSEIKAATQVIKEVKQESTSIGSVLDVIRGIAEQTNLLALNAAIEAARAGEQGRGFAVVADEVRTLATRTSDSTQEIETMVKSLDRKTTEAVEKMQIATEQANISVASVEQAAMSLGEIAGSIRNITIMNQQVAEATKQQSEVSEDINRNITAIQQIAENVVESSSEISETSERVLREVSSLNKLVKM